MSIERQSNGSVEIFVGDQDVLMGFTPTHKIVRVWFAPLHRSDLPMNEPVSVDRSNPPDDVVATVYFLNKECLDGFIKALQDCRSKMSS